MFNYTTVVGWWEQRVWRRRRGAAPVQRPALNRLAQWPVERLPGFVRGCPVALKYLRLLGVLDWERFPERAGGRAWPGPAPAPRAPCAAAFLVKLNEGLAHLGDLRRFLVEHPALVWVLGFRLVPCAGSPFGFDAAACLPSRKHLGRILRELDNAACRFLLHATVTLAQQALPQETLGAPFGDAIALDTKHILAWVEENNPNAWRTERFVKGRQPAGDPDCRLGCKRRTNAHPKQTGKQTGEQSGQGAATALPTPICEGRGAQSGQAGTGERPTPTREGGPASHTRPAGKGEFYWGYASGVVATSAAGWGEFVLAELTQPFDRSDQSFFLPLMAQTEAHLGRAPRFGALDKAYDAFYVYAYFHASGGFAAVPWADSAEHRKQFDASGLPLCAASLAMPLRTTFTQRSHCLVPHEVARYACPLRAEQGAGAACPVAHANFAKGGCTTSLPTSIGARLRHTLDRESQAYKQLYAKRTIAERINSRAVALGVERPHLRNARSIANLTTLTYVLLNLRTLQRVYARQAEERTAKRGGVLAA